MNTKQLLAIVLTIIAGIGSHSIAVAVSEGEMVSIVGMTIILTYISFKQIIKLIKYLDKLN